VKSEVKLSAPMVRLAKMEHTPKPECVKWMSAKLQPKTKLVLAFQTIAIQHFSNARPLSHVKIIQAVKKQITVIQAHQQVFVGNVL
jgi:hypothetical protein